MRVKVDDAAVLTALAAWLAERGWPVADATGGEAVVLVPWEQDEFAAALKLRADLAVWRSAHGGTPVSVDEHLWAAPRVA
jgi:hypothetical protein